MKHTIKSLLAMGIAAAWFVCNPASTVAQSIESMPPVVVKTIPESGTNNVAPGEVEIRVTFSKKMVDGSWSWSDAWVNSSPEVIGKPRYEADHKTCVLKVKLEPNKTYGYWINSPQFHGFADAEGHASIPYLLVFKTRKE